MSTAFSHEALLYAGDDEFVSGTSSFIRDGLAAREPMLVVVSAPKIAALRDELGPDAADVLFADMADVGANPARIIPAWRAFVDDHASSGRPFRGIGEPISAERGPAELVECQRHEALLNLAFADGPGWRLLCPYDTQALQPDVIEEALRTHPVIVDDANATSSHIYYGLDSVAAPFDWPLPEPPGPSERVQFGADDLSALRSFVFGLAIRSGFDPARAEDLVLAVHEIATNSVRHGGGRGVLRAWVDQDTVICEVTDGGRIEHPMAGRVTPQKDREGGRGLWIANQLCDLVQIRTYDAGSVVRMHLRRR
jgi:anti-sigma regulatory factor (Ser/Thr protein kinase)